MEQNKKTKTKKSRQYSNKYCLECYKPGHDKTVCYKILKNEKKKNLSEDKDLQTAEFFNNKVCQLQFCCYHLLMSNYLSNYLSNATDNVCIKI